MVQEMVGLGFEHIELSHGIRISLVPGILRALGEGLVTVSSVHNFCPLPTGITTAAPNLFMPSSADPREHDQWLRHTRRTLEFAHQVAAQVVVLHLGQVDFAWFSPAKKLRNYAERRGAAFDATDAGYQKLLGAAVAKLRDRLPEYLDRVRAGLAEIAPMAAELGLRLGLENRERFEEIPLDDGFGELLAALPEPAVAGAWHDTGHAQIKERAGLLRHREHLAAKADRLLGFHLHDVDAEGRDHLAIGAGVIDFAMVAEFVRPEHIVVLEFSPKLKPEEIVASRERIAALVGGAGATAGGGR